MMFPNSANKPLKRGREKKNDFARKYTSLQKFVPNIPSFTKVLTDMRIF